MKLDYDELKAEVALRSLRLRADLAATRGPRRGGRKRDPSRLAALIELDRRRLAKLEAEGRFVWEGRRITLR